MTEGGLSWSSEQRMQVTSDYLSLNEGWNAGQVAEAMSTFQRFGVFGEQDDAMLLAASKESSAKSTGWSDVRAHRTLEPITIVGRSGGDPAFGKWVIDDALQGAGEVATYVSEQASRTSALVIWDLDGVGCGIRPGSLRSATV